MRTAWVEPEGGGTGCWIWVRERKVPRVGLSGSSQTLPLTLDSAAYCSTPIGQNPIISASF